LKFQVVAEKTTKDARGLLYFAAPGRPAPFPGRMTYKATEPGLVLFYILACFNCIVAY